MTGLHRGEVRRNVQRRHSPAKTYVGLAILAAVTVTAVGMALLR